jgi:hypothetical protein
MIPAVKAAALFLTVAVVVVWIAGRRSGEQCRQARAQARVRVLAVARAQVGMPAGHPEIPLPPDLREHLADGEAHAWFAEQLADITIDQPGGTG